MKQNNTVQTSNEAFVLRHREDDVRQLALKKMPEGVDALWCLQQIEGWQLARRKLPRWASTEGLYYPPRISLEQCSSEQTACYKRMLVQRLLQEGGMAAESFIDLTGGFGIDFSYLASLFSRAVYVERQPHLCDIARHNFQSLGLHHAEVVNEEVSCQCPVLSSGFSLIFLDPARRDDAGRKVVALEDCTPNVIEMQDVLRAHARFVLVKLSPMLDIRLALRQLDGVVEVHVVSVQGECKELLLVMEGGKASTGSPAYHCVDLPGRIPEAVLSGLSPEKESSVALGGSVFIVNPATSLASSGTGGAMPRLSPDDLLKVGKGCEEQEADDVTYLYEPNASVLKAGVQDALTNCFPVAKIQAQSHLFVSREFLPDFPGRGFRILSVGDFSKRSLKAQLQGVGKANLTLRNFPGSVDMLRKQLKIKEGGEDYLFATTWADGRHVLIRCRR